MLKILRPNHRIPTRAANPPRENGAHRDVGRDCGEVDKMSLRCACMTAMLAMPLLAAAAAPEHYTFSPATGRYSWATALNDEGRYGVNSAAPELTADVAA